MSVLAGCNLYLCHAGLFCKGLFALSLFFANVVIECQVFDFMGFMYGPIVANFFHIIALILGIFGAFQYHIKYIAVYALWNIVWISWCIFVICFYLDVGSLNKDSDILSLGTGSRSWWEVNGPGCVPDFSPTGNSSLISDDPDPSRPPRPTRVDGCWAQYQYIEVVQIAIQCLFSVLGIFSGSMVAKGYMDDDDGSMSKKSTASTSVYTVDLRLQGSTVSAITPINGYGVQPVSPRPMTPRRVKRRSVQARDALSRTSQRRKSSQRRRPHQSPVTKLLDQQSKIMDGGVEEGRRAGYTNPVFQQSSTSDINQIGVEDVYRPQSARSSYSNYHASRPISYLHNNEVFSNQAVAQVAINTNRKSAGAATVRMRADLPRPSSFLSQGPPAYRDSETVI